MQVPQAYLELRKSLEHREFSIGYGGILLFPAEELDKWQVGFAVTEDGSSLADDNDPGGWRSSWLVIGHETLCGDPIFLDVSDPEMPVFTSVHGEGDWKPELIGSSLLTFLQNLSLLRNLANGRNNPVEIEANPIGDEERISFLRAIRDTNSAVSLEFWDLLIGSEEPTSVD